MQPVTLSIIIPCFNERTTIEELLRRVFASEIADVEKEVIVVDDGSDDGTSDFLNKCEMPFKLITHPKNLGKGESIKSALKETSGDIILIQDADLEYHPTDYKKLILPILNEEAQIVFGPRRFEMKGRSMGEQVYYAGRKFLTGTTNVLFGSNIKDLNTCYKVFHRNVLDDITLTSKRFEFCSEFTAKALKLKMPIIEVPIQYSPRSRSEGKKIKAQDGWLSLWVLLRVRFAK